MNLQILEVRLPNEQCSRRQTIDTDSVLGLGTQIRISLQAAETSTMLPSQLAEAFHIASASGMWDLLDLGLPTCTGRGFSDRSTSLLPD